MRIDTADSFANYLSSRNRLPRTHDADEEMEREDSHQISSQENRQENRQEARIDLRKQWESTELPAHEFADEVAQFYDLPRVNLQELLSASALTEQFSRRFLLDMTAFPY